jgi:hypothetical protein
MPSPDLATNREPEGVLSSERAAATPVPVVVYVDVAYTIGGR